MDSEAAPDDWTTDGEGHLLLSLVEGWQTGVSLKVGVALRVGDFSDPEQFRTKTAQAIQLLLTAEQAVALGEELLGQGRVAMGTGGLSQ